VGERAEHLYYALDILTKRFAKLLWVPGNHDLWTLPTRKGNGGELLEKGNGEALQGKGSREALRGEEKYWQMVEICREYGVLTPEDPYVTWPGEGVQAVLAPLFLLYDYSFRPDDVAEDRAIAWAEEARTVCSDEHVLHPNPYSSRAAWCEARCQYSEQRLQELSPLDPLILINHFPLRYNLTRRLIRIPRFSLWCGTRRTEDWHTRYHAHAVVYGHLHIRATDYQDGVRFEEVSLGYPQNWQLERGVRTYLREILPGPSEHPQQAGPQWRDLYRRQ
jgi:hypothetical protein